MVGVSVLLDGGTYKMWYLPRNVADRIALGYATSINTEAISINTRCGYAPLHVDCTLNSSAEVAAVLWEFGDSSSSEERDPQHMYAGAGSYNIKASVLTIGGKRFALDGGTVVVHGQAPNAKPTFTPRVGAAPLTVHFTDASDGEIVSRLWEFGDGSTSDEANPTHTYATAEGYEVRLTTTGPCPGAAENLSSATDVVLAGSLPSVEFEQAGPHCVRLIVTTPFSLKGGEVGVAYDSSVLMPTVVKPGPDLPVDAAIRFQSDPSTSCSSDLGVLAGFTIGWINSLGTNVETPAGRQALLKVCFEPASSSEIGDCAPLRFVSCLGVPGAFVRNVVTDSQDRSVPLFPLDGQACVLPDRPIQRGDANQDGNFDISDPIGILGCLFLGSKCSTCPDAADSNDDGFVNISDAVYLLNWRFAGTAPPPAPFSECGQDTTTDSLDDCESFGPCT